MACFEVDVNREEVVLRIPAALDAMLFRSWAGESRSRLRLISFSIVVCRVCARAVPFGGCLAVYCRRCSIYEMSAVRRSARKNSSLQKPASDAVTIVVQNG